MITITVSTAPGKPTFEVPENTPAAIVRKMVAEKFGYVTIGVPHNWSGNLTSTIKQE